MKVRFFPDGKVHSAYLDMVEHPPEGVEYMGGFSYSPGTQYDIGGGETLKGVLDLFGLPYVVPLRSDCLIHSCQKLPLTRADFVVDIEHGNPFMGAYSVHKHLVPQFRYIVKKILLVDNCKGVMPWSEKSREAFCLNFGFLGEKFLNDKVSVINPTTSPIYDIPRKFADFTFMFVGGESFYAKGGVQTLLAMGHMNDQGINAKLVVVGNTPEAAKRRFRDNKNVSFFGPMPRGILLNMLSQCNCLVLPSVGDTYGMTIMEAKAVGVPAIVVDSFAAKELVADGKTGLVIRPDVMVDPWFDEHGRKRKNKREFHSQFGSYNPSIRHVMDLYHAMRSCVLNARETERMGRVAFKEIEDGRFSIGERNKKLIDVYGR